MEWQQCERTLQPTLQLFLRSANAVALPLTVRLRAPHSRGTVDRFRVPALVSQQCNGQYKLVLLSRRRQQRAHA
jgi:hypothetical protein